MSNLTMQSDLMVQTATHSYPIFFSHHVLASLDTLIAPYCKGHIIVIITDQQVADIHLSAVHNACERIKKQVHVIIVPPGEESKSFAIFQRVCEELLSFQPDRHTTLIALGGGVIGDLTGFVASVTLRGLPFIQVPTTLLAQVDSSVGGKTAINCAAGKNLIGSFYPPLAVIMDSDTLGTLSKREMLAGYGEVIKYGLLGDADFYEKLLAHGEKMLAGDSTLQQDIILHCCVMKAAIVQKDEKEQGIRALLNLGHTFAHSIEKEAGYDGSVNHGEAVALGCLMAMSLSIPHISQVEIERLKTHYDAVGLPCRLSDLGAALTWDAERLTQHCYQDKKASEGKLTFVTLRNIGEAVVDKHIDPSRIFSIFKEYR